MKHRNLSALSSKLIGAALEKEAVRYWHEDRGSEATLAAHTKPAEEARAKLEAHVKRLEKIEKRYRKLVLKGD